MESARAALAERVESSLFIVTTAACAEERSGCLVGFVTQCSIEPPRFLVCISKLNHTYFVVERADTIVLHLLGAEQTELASLFGELTGDVHDKFERCHWSPTSTGVPILVECAAWAECRILERFGVGDHQALLVRPLRGGEGPARGVLTTQTAPTFQPGHPATP